MGKHQNSIIRIGISHQHILKNAMFMGHLTVGAKCSATSMSNTLLRQARLTDYAMRSLSGELNVSMIVSDIFSLDYRSKVLTSRNTGAWT